MATPGIPRSTKHYRAFPEKNRLRSAKYRETHKEALRLSMAAYKKRRAAYYAALRAKYQAAKIQRIPKWLTASDWTEINWAYEIAEQKTLATGIKHEVDHILPLRGKNVSGLHVPQNLSVITEKENCAKGNRT